MTPRDWLSVFLTRNPFVRSRSDYGFASATLAAKIAEAVNPVTGEAVIVARRVAESVGLTYLRAYTCLKAMARDGWITKKGVRGRETHIALSLPDNLEARWREVIAARCYDNGEEE